MAIAAVLAILLRMRFFVKSIASGFALAMGSALFKKVSKKMGLEDEKTADEEAEKQAAKAAKKKAREAEAEETKNTKMEEAELTEEATRSDAPENDSRD